MKYEKISINTLFSLQTVLGVGNRMMSKNEPGAALRSTRFTSEDIQVKRASLKKQPLARDVKESSRPRQGPKDRGRQCSG